MSVLDALRGSYAAAEGLGRIARALERLADAAERAYPLPLREGEDQSGVFYTNYEELVALEGRQQRYWEDTGIRLAPGEEPPKAL